MNSPVPPADRFLSSIKRFVPGPVKLAARARWKNGRLCVATADRVLLEDTILPFFARDDSVGRVLDIGTDWYTWRYHTFFPGRSYQTIDFDPRKAKFAGAGHIVGSALELDRYFGESQFDLILCNGVFGWGINSREEVETAAAQFDHCLSPGGYILIGWNKWEGCYPDFLDEILLQRFHRFVFPSLGVSEIDTRASRNHHYTFYVKPGS